MRRWVLLLSFVVVLWPATAAAQSPGDVQDESALIRINSDALVQEGETVDNLVVISGNAVIEGTVTGSLLVIDGNATVSGTVGEDVTVISGNVNLTDGANVDNVHSIRGDVEQAEGATVTGNVEESDLSGFWAFLGVFSVLLWLGVTVALIVAGIMFALIGGRQLTGAATLMTTDAVKAIIGAVFLVVALPILAALIMVTVIGLPLGLGILLFVMPVVFFLGYLVAATRLGLVLTGAINREPGGRPLLAAVLGVLVLQVVLLIPFLGGVIVLLASLWGAGALAAYAFLGVRSRPMTPESPPAPA